MDVVSQITEAITPSLEAMGYELVLVRMSEASRRRTLTVMAERADGVEMNLDDCTEISRTISALLDVEDPISGAYDLEVSSPGIDRPLTRAKDFQRFAGREAKMEVAAPVNGRKRFKGVLQGIKGETIALAMPEGNVEIAFSNVRTAKLVMTDELAESFLKQQKKKRA